MLPGRHSEPMQRRPSDRPRSVARLLERPTCSATCGRCRSCETAYSASLVSPNTRSPSRLPATISDRLSGLADAGVTTKRSTKTTRPTSSTAEHGPQPLHRGVGQAGLGRHVDRRRARPPTHTRTRPEPSRPTIGAPITSAHRHGQDWFPFERNAAQIHSIAERPDGSENSVVRRPTGLNPCRRYSCASRRSTSDPTVCGSQHRRRPGD